MSTPSDMFRNSVWSVINTLHTCLPGIIKNFDPSTNKATIQPALNKAYTSGVVEMPVLENVPVMFPKNVFFPIEEGDYVLLVFAERAIDLWLSVGGQVTPDDPRKFNLSDAIAIPGLQPFTGDFSANNGQDYSVNFAGSEIRIKSSGEVQIKTANKVAIGTLTTELLQVLSTLMTYLQGPAVTGTTLGGPLNPTFTTLVNALQIQLDLIKGTII